MPIILETPTQARSLGRMRISGWAVAAFAAQWIAIGCGSGGSSGGPPPPIDRSTEIVAISATSTGSFATGRPRSWAATAGWCRVETSHGRRLPQSRRLRRAVVPEPGLYRHRRPVRGLRDGRGAVVVLFAHLAPGGLRATLRLVCHRPWRVSRGPIGPIGRAPGIGPRSARHRNRVRDRPPYPRRMTSPGTPQGYMSRPRISRGGS